MYCVQQKVTDDVSITRPTLIWMGPVLLISLTSGKIVLQHIWCSWTFISYPEWHENDLYISFYVMVFPFFTNLYSKSLCLMQTPWDVKPSQLYTFICNWVTHNYQFRAIDAAMRAHLLVYNSYSKPDDHHSHHGCHDHDGRHGHGRHGGHRRCLVVCGARPSNVVCYLYPHKSPNNLLSAKAATCPSDLWG